MIMKKGMNISVMSIFDRYPRLQINSLFTFYIMNRQMSDSRIIILRNSLYLFAFFPTGKCEGGGGGEYEIMKMGLVENWNGLRKSFYK